MLARLDRMDRAAAPRVMRVWRVVFNDRRPDEYVRAHERRENSRDQILDQVFTLNPEGTAWDERVIDGSNVRGLFEQ